MIPIFLSEFFNLFVASCPSVLQSPKPTMNVQIIFTENPLANLTQLLMMLEWNSNILVCYN